MPKIISNKRYQQLVTTENIHHQQNMRLNDLVWLSEFDWSNSIREYIFGFYRGNINNFREIVRKQYLDQVGASKEEWNKVVLENGKLKQRLAYLEGLASKGLKDV